jgi:hypothetical protein
LRSDDIAPKSLLIDDWIKSACSLAVDVPVADGKDISVIGGVAVEMAA